MVELKIVAVGVWFALLALAERLAPAARRPLGGEAPRLGRNLGLWAANTLMRPLLIVPIAAAATSLQLWTRPDASGWIVLDLLLLDLWAYFWHRANHEWTWLWRFHSVHHRDEFLDTTSAVRFHPGEVLISALARAPLIVAADISLASVLAFDAMVLISTLFHHSNVRLPARFEAGLRLLIVTPSHHWVHHHAIRVDTDSNYGALLTVWDKLFGTWSPTARTPEMEIGVEGEADAPLASLALAPFR